MDWGPRSSAGARECSVWRDRPLLPTDIQTLPFPGFPTDMQAQTMCLLALAKGELHHHGERFREPLHVCE